MRGRSRAGYSLALTENLEYVHVALIDRAEHKIDLAAYVLTDWPIMQDSHERPITAFKSIHIFDGTQLAKRELTKVFHDLTETPGVELLSDGSKHKDLCV